MMATNKNAQIRYKILDNCFRNSGRKYFIEDLITECNKKLEEINPKFKGISRRRIFDDINFMESAEGYEIDLLRLNEGKRIYYRYADTSFSINNMPLNEADINRLQTTLQTLSQFKGMPQFEWMYKLLPKLKQENTEVYIPSIMEFEENQDLKGREYIETLYDAIIYQKILKINYMPSFNSEVQLVIHPYYLKQYNSRWFLFGYNPQTERYNEILALDRISEINEIHEPFIQNTQIEWSEYFDDIMGVSKPEGGVPEKITLHFYGKTAHYIETKPMHPYQKHRWIDAETLEVNLELIVNYELGRFILSYADSVKVMQPQSLIDTIKERMRNAVAQYSL
jgi:predicted DNA-binding transcriptional regulator YafY